MNRGFKTHFTQCIIQSNNFPSIIISKILFPRERPIVSLRQTNNIVLNNFANITLKKEVIQVFIVLIAGEANIDRTQAKFMKFIICHKLIFDSQPRNE